MTMPIVTSSQDITERLDNLAQNMAKDGEYPPHVLTDLGEAASKITMLRKALAALHHAVCGETGFAEAVRRDSGLAYPWPALDEADLLARAALSQEPTS